MICLIDFMKVYKNWKISMMPEVMKVGHVAVAKKSLVHMQDLVAAAVAIGALIQQVLEEVAVRFYHLAAVARGALIQQVLEEVAVVLVAVRFYHVAAVARGALI
jgi:hypothetical protein